MACGNYYDTGSDQPYCGNCSQHVAAHSATAILGGDNLLTSVPTPPERFGQHIMDPANDPERRFIKDRLPERLKTREEIEKEQAVQMEQLRQWTLKKGAGATPQYVSKPLVQAFETGATRSDDSYKPDYEGFLSPLVLRAYAEYMQEHRTQDDGTVRESDNWQRGMPFHKYIKSLWRHFMQLWLLHRGITPEPEKRAGKLVPVTLTSAVAGILFNTMGYFHEYLKSESAWKARVISEYADGTVVRGKEAA